MSGKSSRVAVFAALSIALAAPGPACRGCRHQRIRRCHTSIPESQRDATVNAVQAFYEF